MTNPSDTMSELHFTDDQKKFGLVPFFFSESHQNAYLNYNQFDVETIRKNIESIGFSIAKGLVQKECIDRIRSFWIENFSKANKNQRVTWGPHLGQANHIGFSNDGFQNLYRACDFLWNEPFHVDTREVCLRLYALRNHVLGEFPLRALLSKDGRFGVFVTASYYPPHTGFMAQHNDGVPNKTKLVHSLVPITFKGRDYNEGGMHVVDRSGREIDVDSLLEPGDVVFYDGSLNHSVKTILPKPDQNLGRIQIFPIPTVFNNLENNIFAISRIPISKYFKGKYLWANNFLRNKLGFSPLMR